MATPPPVSAEQASAAINRIAERRRQIDDEHAWQLTDDPHETLRYLRKHSSGIPAAVAEADILDGLLLKVRLWWLAEEAEWWLLERAREAGISTRSIGALLGVSSRQGVHDRLRLARRKVSVLRGAPVRDRRPPASEEQRQEEQLLGWLAARRSEITEIAREALAFRSVAGDEAADWLADVANDLAESAVTPGSVQVLRFALVELESDDLSGQHADRLAARDELLARWSRLYATRPP